MRVIEKVPTYRCDGCGELFIDADGQSGYVGVDIWNKAYEKGEWEEIDGKHYCPNCYEFDVMTDDNGMMYCDNCRPKNNEQ